MGQLSHLNLELNRERIKWVEIDKIHITLKFLGDTDENKIPDIERIFRKVTEGYSPFSIRLNTLGVFGSIDNPRVIWAGIEPSDNIVSLMNDIHAELKSTEYIGNDRQNVVPHLTIGRIIGIKDKKKFQGIMNRARKFSSQLITINECILYESILKKEGPVYLPLKAFPFVSLCNHSIIQH